jgi:hypothetical protein
MSLQCQILCICETKNVYKVFGTCDMINISTSQVSIRGNPRINAKFDSNCLRKVVPLHAHRHTHVALYVLDICNLSYATAFVSSQVLRHIPPLTTRRRPFGWWEEVPPTRVGWRCSMGANGGRCVMTAGTERSHTSCTGRWESSCECVFEGITLCDLIVCMWYCLSIDV